MAPADGNVEWAASDGEDISFVSVSTTAVFFINDDALETTKAATAEWIGFAANQGDANNTFDIAAGTVNGATTTSFTLTATAYDTTTPANTPLTSAPTVTVGRNHPRRRWVQRERRHLHAAYRRCCQHHGQLQLPHTGRVVQRRQRPAAGQGRHYLRSSRGVRDHQRGGRRRNPTPPIPPHRSSAGTSC